MACDLPPPIGFDYNSESNNSGTMKAMEFIPHNQDHSEAIQKRLFELGYEWLDSGRKVLQNGDSPFYTDKNGKIYLSNICEATKTNLDDLYKMEEPILINGDTVQFCPGGITVGCTKVDKETVKKIWQKLSKDDYKMAH